MSVSTRVRADVVSVAGVRRLTFWTSRCQVCSEPPPHAFSGPHCFIHLTESAYPASTDQVSPYRLLPPLHPNPSGSMGNLGVPPLISHGSCRASWSGDSFRAAPSCPRLQRTISIRIGIFLRPLDRYLLFQQSCLNNRPPGIYNWLEGCSDTHSSYQSMIPSSFSRYPPLDIRLLHIRLQIPASGYPSS